MSDEGCFLGCNDGEFAAFSNLEALDTDHQLEAPPGVNLMDRGSINHVINQNQGQRGLPVSEPITGRPGLRKTYFSSANLESFGNKKSRCAVFRFENNLPPHHKSYVDKVVNNLFTVYKGHGGYGFRVKSSTFFDANQGLWIVLNSWEGQTFNKWLKVFKGLKAVEVIIPYTTRDYAGPSVNSLESVLDAFKDETTIEELMENRELYSVDEVMPQKRARSSGTSGERHSPPAKKSRRDTFTTPVSPKSHKPSRFTPASPTSRRTTRTSPPTKLKRHERSVMQGIPVEEEEQAHVGKELDFSPSVPSRPLKNASRVSDELIQICLSFISGQDLSGLEAHHANLCGHLFQNDNYGLLGKFFLSGRVMEMYERTSHMRQLVQHTLSQRYNLRVASLSTPDIICHDEFAALDDHTKLTLQGIGYCCEGERATPVFSLIDQVCCICFLSVYVLSHALDGTREPFMASYQGAILEVVRWYARFSHRMNSFLGMPVLDAMGGIAPGQECMFPLYSSEEHVAAEYLRDYPPLQQMYRIQQSKKNSYWRNKFNAALLRVQKEYKIAKFGVAIDVFASLQRNAGALHKMLPTDEAFRMLPATMDLEDRTRFGDAGALSNYLEENF